MSNVRSIDSLFHQCRSGRFSKVERSPTALASVRSTGKPVLAHRMVHWACLQHSALLRRVKGVMLQFFLHRCPRAMPRQEQTVRRQGHHVPLHRLEMSMIELRRIGSADRAGKQRIADERHRSPWHFHSIANATGRMAGSGSATDLQVAHGNRPTVVGSRKLLSRKVSNGAA